MATTALFVEILVIGALAEIWISIAILWVSGISNLINVATAAKTLGTLSPFLVAPALALTYVLGWNLNFVSERLFKKLFQKRLRDAAFEGEATPYPEAKMLVLQKGSPDLVQDTRFDRHVIRIARTNVINFTLIPAALVPHMKGDNWKIVLPCSLLAILIAFVSFMQWKTRYVSHYEKVKRAVRTISS